MPPTQKPTMQWHPVQGSQPLAPFDHQVAGQSSMLRYDTTTVCKPLIPRENFVYKTLPEELKNFTPEYRGEIEVRLKEEDGFIQLYGVPVASETIDTVCPCSIDPHHSDTEAADVKPRDAEKPVENGSMQKCMIRVLRSGSYEVSPSTGEVFCTKDSNPNHQRTLSLNPWSLKNHKRLLDKMRKSEHSGDKICFMLLKNVVADFRHPCILDLKIGSRLHGDDASSKKVESQSNKCKQTTSSSLSLRLCGMQVYQVNEGVYHSIDKYHGRTLKDDSFQDTLYEFLHNGIHFRSDLLQPIVSKLSVLIKCLQGLSSYRFYASSLLIIYDGDVSAELIHQETKGNAFTPSVAKELITDDELQEKVPASSQDVQQTHSGKSTTLSEDDSNIYNLSSSLKLLSSNELYKFNNSHSPSSTVTLELLAGNESTGNSISEAADTHCCDKEPSKVCSHDGHSDHFVSTAVVKEECNSGEVPTMLDDTSSSLFEPHSFQNVPSKITPLVDVVSSNHCLGNSSDMISAVETTGPIDYGNQQAGSIWDQSSDNDNSVWLNSHHSYKQVSSHTSTQITPKAETSHSPLAATHQNKVDGHRSLLDYRQNPKTRTSDLSKSEDKMDNSNGIQKHLPQQNVNHTNLLKSDSQVQMSQSKDHLAEPISEKQEQSSHTLVSSSETHTNFPAQQKQRKISNRPSNTDGQESTVVPHKYRTLSSKTKANEGDNLSNAHQNKHQIPTLPSTDFNHRNGEVKVDVQMIDFAHTTHKGFTSDRVKHTGPDIDYICGLQNLMRLFQKMQEER